MNAPCPNAIAIALEPVNPAPTPVEDGSDLVGRARAGDGDAFDALCRIHGDRLYRQALGLCRDAAAAEDLVQETLIAAWGSLGRYDGGCRIFTWLCSILIHRHRSRLRRRWPRLFSSLPGAGDAGGGETSRVLETLADPDPGPAEAAVVGERAAAVLRSLDRLPARQREVVYLRFYADDTLEGIAVALGCSVGTVKSRLFHGLERLRRLKVLAGEETRSS